MTSRICKLSPIILQKGRALSHSVESVVSQTKICYDFVSYLFICFERGEKINAHDSEYSGAFVDGMKKPSAVYRFRCSSKGLLATPFHHMCLY